MIHLNSQLGKHYIKNYRHKEQKIFYENISFFLEKARITNNHYEVAFFFWNILIERRKCHIRGVNWVPIYFFLARAPDLGDLSMVTIFIFLAMSGGRISEARFRSSTANAWADFDKIRGGVSARREDVAQRISCRSVKSFWSKRVRKKLASSALSSHIVGHTS